MQSLRSVPTNILHNTVMVCLQQLALLVPTLRPTRWQQWVSTARRRRLNCRRVGWAVARRCERSTAWLTARRNCSVSYAPLSNRDTHALHCCSKSLKQYPYNFECFVRYVFGFVREIITYRAHSFAFTWSYAVYMLWRSTPLFSARHFPVLQILPLRFRPSFSSPANSTPAISSVIFQSCKFQSCKFSYPQKISTAIYI